MRGLITESPWSGRSCRWFVACSPTLVSKMACFMWWGRAVWRYAERMACSEHPPYTLNLFVNDTFQATWGLHVVFPTQESRLEWYPEQGLNSERKLWIWPPDFLASFVSTFNQETVPVAASCSMKRQGTNAETYSPVVRNLNFSPAPPNALHCHVFSGFQQLKWQCQYELLCP